MSSTLEISELGIPSPHAFIFLYIQKPHVIGTSLHNTPMMSCPLLAGKSAHAPGHLSGGSHSEQDTKVATLVAPSLQRGKWWPQAHTMTLSPW